MNFKHMLALLKKKFKDEKAYADVRDTGLLERCKYHNDSQLSFYKYDFENFRKSPDGKTYCVVFEEDRSQEEGKFEHMFHLEFSSYAMARQTYDLIKDSNMAIIFSPATATK